MVLSLTPARYLAPSLKMSSGHFLNAWPYLLFKVVAQLLMLVNFLMNYQYFQNYLFRQVRISLSIKILKYKSMKICEISFDNAHPYTQRICLLCV